MDRHKNSDQVERLEVVDSGRRRRWSEDEKLRIVLESLAAPRQVTATARRHGIARSQLIQWRRSFRPQRNETPEQSTGFVPAIVVSEPEPGQSAPAGLAAEGMIEIDFTSGARLRVTGAVDPATLRAAVEALTGGHSR